MDPEVPNVERKKKKRPKEQPQPVPSDSAPYEESTGKSLDGRINSVAQLSQWTDHHKESKGERNRQKHRASPAAEPEAEKTLDGRIHSMAQLSQWTQHMDSKGERSHTVKHAPVSSVQHKSDADESRTFDTRINSVAQLSKWTEQMDSKGTKNSQMKPVSQNIDDRNMTADQRANSVAQLSQWTNVMNDKDNSKVLSQPQKSAAPAKVTKIEEDYEEEFEDYEEEDFEQEDDVAPPKVAVKLVPSAKLTQQQPPQQQDLSTGKESKSHLSAYTISKSNTVAERPAAKEVAQSVSSKKSKKSSPVSNMFGDPRSVRVNKILDSGVMDLQVEKFTQLNIAPTTKYDLYHHELRSLPPTIKQIGVPVDLEQREMETNTEEITMVDSGMQFSYGDDTALYMAIENIKNKDGKNTSKASLEKRDIAASSTGDATKLTSFLQRTSYLFDTLLNERNNKEDEGKRDTDDNNRYALFDREVEWLRLGLGKADGSNELLKTRGTVSARFSELQPHIVVTAHPFPEGDAAEEDLRPYMGLYGVWDIASPDAPSYVLEAPGQPTACCMSYAQTFVVVAGTTEGSLHLWDLREQNNIHRDRDTMDLGITRGIRKPCYSSHLSSLMSLQELEEDQHTAPIMSIQSIDHFADSDSKITSSVVSQFASIDEAGCIIFWVTSQSTIDDIEADFGRSPWGRLSLVVTKKLSPNSFSFGRGLGHAWSSTEATHNKDRLTFYSLHTAVQQAKVAFSTVPNDPSLILVSATGGKIVKVGRFGDAPHPHVFDRSNANNFDVVCGESKTDRGGGSKAVDFFLAATCIDVRSSYSLDHSASSCLFLVGRSDGSIDLFQLDAEAPLVSWNLPSFLDSAEKSTTNQVVLVRWCPKRPSVFFAVDEAANVYLFDLSNNLFRPVFIDKLDSSHIRSSRIDISTVAPGSKRFHLLLVDRASNRGISVKKLNKSILTSTFKNLADEEDHFRESLSKWSSRNIITNGVAYIGSSG